LTALAVHAVAQTLVDFAEIAAQYDYEQFQRRIPETFGIGVATAAPRGLYVPVIRHAETLSPEEISIELNRLVAVVKQGGVTAEIVRGGCFTVTNIGAMGVHGGVPLPNSPQNAILGIASVRAQAVIRQGSVQPGLTTSLTLSIDHRGVDGITAARFLTTLGGRLQETDSPIEVQPTDS
jgi:pyruvate dehydrogenase E2 component (dihydrolipoamide acetyltransferase)